MKTHRCKNDEKHKDKKNRIGIIFLIIGFVLLAKNLHLFPMHLYPILFSWQMLLIAIGLVQLFISRSNVGGYVLIGVGGLFLWNKVLPLSPWQWEIAWPGLFILVGMVLVFGYLLKSPKRTIKPEAREKTKFNDVEFDIDKIEPIES